MDDPHDYRPYLAHEPHEQPGWYWAAVLVVGCIMAAGLLGLFAWVAA